MPVECKHCGERHMGACNDGYDWKDHIIAHLLVCDLDMLGDEEGNT